MTVLSNIITPSNVLTTTNTATVTNKTLTSPTVAGMTVSDGTANGVTYLNGSKVLTSGSALTFDGTNLGVGVTNPTDFNSDMNDLVVGGSGARGITIYSSNSDSTNLAFADGFTTAADEYRGLLQYAHSDNSMRFFTDATEGMRLNASGNLGIGLTSPSSKLHVRGTSGTYTGGIIAQDATGNFFNFFGYGSDGVIGTAGNIRFASFDGSSERARFDSSGNLGIGTTSPNQTGFTAPVLSITNGTSGILELIGTQASNGTVGQIAFYNTSGSDRIAQILGLRSGANNSGAITFQTNNAGTLAERARIDTSGNLLVGTTNTNPGGSDINGIALIPGGFSVISALGVTPFGINRGTDDGTLINFSQAGTTEGTISVSGTTVSYNGGHLSRYAQTTTAKDNSLVKGTVLSNLDEMNVYTKDGQPVENEQLNKVKVSDTEGDVNVAGVFVNWSHDEDHNVDEINMAMTGDMIIRIAQGVTVVRGDLLMSAGDGTAKPQGDDIIRSKTVAKVTSNHVTCTYADGSYCVPCVLMAC